MALLTVLSLLGALIGAPRDTGAAEKVLTVAIDANPSSLDIQDAQTFLTGLVLGIHVYDRLFEQSPRGLRPMLAERWETSADGRTWTFHLRRGVKFHDGTPFNAAAVKESIARVVNPELKLRQASKWAGVTSVDVVDEHTVKITTNRPLGALPGNLSHQAGGSIQSPTAAKAGKFPVGTGPFELIEYVPDERLVLASNKDYWGGAPGIDRLIFRIVPEARTRLAMLQSGGAQVIYNVAPNEIEGLRKDPNVHVEVPPSAGWRVFGFNTQKKPYTDVRVRQALNYAVDKASIVRNIFKGVGHVADSPYGPGMFAYTPVMTYAYDPAKAKKLLAEAGYANGFKATMIVSPGEIAGGAEVAAAVQAYLQQVGVQAEIVSLEQATWLAELTRPLEQNRTEIFQYQYGGADPDALRLVLHSKEWPPRRNAAFFKNVTLDRLLEEGAATVDQAKRAEIYQQAQRLVMVEAPWLFLSDWAHADAWRANVQGVSYILQDIGLIDLRKVTIR
ncbi:MAG: ABC transporter substrate-binding protein [Candidatus Rokuibacteriota bacterium]